MRSPGSDGSNSAAHVALGVMASAYGPDIILPGFVFYQLAQGGANMLVDIAEFALGFVAGEVFKRVVY